MTFLAPTALIGILLLAIPILVHLFKPRKMRRTPFSSLRWLKQTHQRLSRRIQWHQWLLFLMRAGVVASLVLAMSRPLIGWRGSDRAVDRFIILDVGRGMGYTIADVPTPLAQAQNVAEKLVNHARPGDRTALLLAGAAPRILTGPVADAGAYLPALRAAGVTGAEQPLTGVLPLVQALATTDVTRVLELVFLTDPRRQRWRQNDIQAFLKDAPANVNVRIVDAGPGSATNAWIAGARLFDAAAADARVLRVVMNCVGEAQQRRTLRLTGLSDLPDDVQEVSLTPGVVTAARFKIPGNLELAGRVAELRLEPADALASDDRWFVNLDASGGMRVLIIEPADAEAGRGPGLHLRAAIESLAEADHQATAMVNRTHKSIAPSDVAGADLVFLAGVPELSDSVVEALERRVRAGAGAMVFLGDGIALPFYQQKMHKALQPADGLLPFAPAVNEPIRTDAPGVLTGVSWSHALLAPLRDPVLNDLQQVRFRKYAAWSGSMQSSDRVLAHIDDGEPAIVEHPLGAGRVLLLNTSADDAWSDLPRRRCFVPLLDRMIAYLTGGGLRRDFIVGDSATLALADAKTDVMATVTSPSGVKLTLRRLLHGDLQTLQFDELAEAGAYRVEYDSKTTNFTANVGRAGSPLTTIDPATIESWWAPARVEMVSAETALRQVGEANSWPLWPAFLFLAGLLLLAETIYVHRLCPRSDPAVVESIVPRRTVLQPLQEKPV